MRDVDHFHDQQSINDGAADPPIACPIFPVVPQVSMQCVSNRARVTERRDTIHHLQNSGRYLPIQFADRGVSLI